MSVTNYWKNYYLNTKGNLKKHKKTLEDYCPAYLQKAKSDFAPVGTFRGWNRSAYFRFKANRDYIKNQLEKKIHKQHPDWSSSSWSAPPAAQVKSGPSRIISPLRPSLIKKRPKSELKPIDILTKVKHLINGKVVIVTPNLIVTRTSPTPEDTLSPSTEAQSLENGLKVYGFLSVVVLLLSVSPFDFLRSTTMIPTHYIYFYLAP